MKKAKKKVKKTTPSLKDINTVESICDKASVKIAQLLKDKGVNFIECKVFINFDDRSKDFTGFDFKTKSKNKYLKNKVLESQLNDLKGQCE